MTRASTSPDVVALSHTVARRMGLHFPARRHADLWRGIAAAAHDLGFEDAATCARELCSASLTRTQIEILASHLTIGETYFFRERAGLDALRDTVLPPLIEARRAGERRLRIWSAGCCTGEEPYSMAMLLDGLLPDIDAWEITLLATDINPVFLRKAAQGRYRPWSFRSCPVALKMRYFSPVADEEYELADRIRRLVTFEYLNLAEDHYPSLLNNTNAMDVILCRNTLMYFEPSVAGAIVARFGNCLVENGCLVVAPSETAMVSGEGFESERIGQACLWRRVSAVHAYAHGARAATSANPRRRIFPRRAASSGRPRPPRAPSAASRLADACREAETLYAGGMYPEAVHRLLPHLKAGRRPARARQWGAGLRLVARAYANQGLLEDAEQWCRQALRSEPADPGLHYLLATILQEEGHLGEAHTLLKSTVRLDDGFVLAHFALGALSLQEGHNRSAGHHFEAAIALLEKVPPDMPVPESEGIPAGRLIEIIRDQKRGVRAP